MANIQPKQALKLRSYSSFAETKRKIRFSQLKIRSVSLVGLHASIRAPLVPFSMPIRRTAGVHFHSRDVQRGDKCRLVGHPSAATHSHAEPVLHAENQAWPSHQIPIAAACHDAKWFKWVLRKQFFNRVQCHRLLQAPLHLCHYMPLLKLVHPMLRSVFRLDGQGFGEAFGADFEAEFEVL